MPKGHWTSGLFICLNSLSCTPQFAIWAPQFQSPFQTSCLYSQNWTISNCFPVASRASTLSWAKNQCPNVADHCWEDMDQAVSPTFTHHHGPHFNLGTQGIGSSLMDTCYHRWPLGLCHSIMIGPLDITILRPTHTQGAILPWWLVSWNHPTAHETPTHETPTPTWCRTHQGFYHPTSRSCPTPIWVWIKIEMNNTPTHLIGIFPFHPRLLTICWSLCQRTWNLMENSSCLLLQFFTFLSFNQPWTSTVVCMTSFSWTLYSYCLFYPRNPFTTHKGALVETSIGTSILLMPLSHVPCPTEGG